MDTLVFVHSQDSCQDLMICMICFAYPIPLLDGYLWVVNGYHGFFRLFSFFLFGFWFPQDFGPDSGVADLPDGQFESTGHLGGRE